MLSYRNWKLISESFLPGVNLGVSTPQSISAFKSFYDETKKKMLLNDPDAMDDELDVPPEGDEELDFDDEDMGDEDMGDEDMDDEDMDDEDMDDEDMGDEDMDDEDMDDELSDEEIIARMGKPGMDKPGMGGMGKPGMGGMGKPGMGGMPQMESKSHCGFNMMDKGDKKKDNDKKKDKKGDKKPSFLFGKKKDDDKNGKNGDKKSDFPFGKKKDGEEKNGKNGDKAPFLFGKKKKSKEEEKSLKEESQREFWASLRRQIGNGSTDQKYFSGFDARNEDALYALADIDLSGADGDIEPITEPEVGPGDVGYAPQTRFGLNADSDYLDDVSWPSVAEYTEWKKNKGKKLNG